MSFLVLQFPLTVTYVVGRGFPSDVEETFRSRFELLPRYSLRQAAGGVKRRRAGALQIKEAFALPTKRGYYPDSIYIFVLDVIDTHYECSPFLGLILYENIILLLLE